MENLDIYNLLKEVPEEAKKQITGGRLSGMTDIKPMWRIEKLTETFGMCGIGWKTIIKNKEIIEGANGEKIAIVDIDLYVKVDDEWSEAIEGTGGSSFIAKEKNGLYTSDECFKMAYTDALSVACKSLGMGADVYWGDSKYNTTKEPTQEEADSYTLTFGKYKGQTLKQIEEQDHKYINWLMDNTKDERILKMIEMSLGYALPDEEEQQERFELLDKVNNLIIEKDIDLEAVKKKFKVESTQDIDTKTLKELVVYLEGK